MGQLAKTDALDATLLADFAQRVRPEPRPLPDEAAQLLERLLTRRRQIVDVLTAAKNRLGFARGPVKRDISQHFRWLEERLADEGGRAPVLAVLDVAALVGLTHTPVIRVRYERRRAAGKPFKTAATARRRKLLTILNAMLTHHRRWGPEYA
jgi:transposase